MRQKHVYNWQKETKLAITKGIRSMKVKNKILPAVILLMSLSVVALTGIQLYWIKQAVEVHDNQFKTNVNEALRVVANRLQLIETASIIIEATSKADEIEKQIIPSNVPSNGDLPKENPTEEPLTDHDKGRHSVLGVNYLHGGGKNKIDKIECAKNVFITTEGNLTIKQSRVCSIMVSNDYQNKGIKTSVENCKRQAHQMHNMLNSLLISRQDSASCDPVLNNDQGYISSGGHGEARMVLTSGKSTGYPIDLEHSSIEEAAKLWQSGDNSNEAANSSQAIRRKKLEQKANLIQHLLKELTVAERPIEERVNLITLDSILKEEIHNFGINRSFTYGIIGKDSMISFSSPMTRNQIKNMPFKVRLFQYDLNKEPYILALNFTDAEPSIWDANSLVLSLAGVSLSIILLSFGYTVFTINRQKKLTQMKTDFINNMTHEFKTPITTISLLSEMLAQTTENTKPEKIKRYAGIIYDENRRLEDQVVRVLQMAEIDRKEIKLDIVNVDVNESVENAINKVSVQVEQKGGRITKNLADDVILIRADALHFSNMIFNLIDNANKYSSETPDITVTTTEINNEVTISIQDKGIGMSADQIRHIFQKFYRVPTGNRHDVKGFGLGLSYVKSLVEAHGGRIKVKSEIGVGSRFELIFPTEPKSL